jgi:GT2 family glycosyltransferase
VNVTALLVSHDGARWLPAVLAGLGAQTRRPDRVVAVDTGSTDGSERLVAQALGVEPVPLPATSTWGQAVRAGLAALPPAGPDEWVWLLHDDLDPDPACLSVLVEVAEGRPAEPLPEDDGQTSLVDPVEHGEVAIVGPKLREWPSLRRLLEVGVTISGTGRRETGLEPGEYDQGQHDRVHPVLAVNTAGMLVRRDVLESVGFDDRLPFHGTDLDFGWRAALAGHRTVVVPQAVAHHVEAAHRDRRQSPQVAHPRAGERAAAITTLLVNGPAALVPWRVVRLFLGGLLRTLGFLLVRAAPEARGELAALARVYLRPHRIWAMRRDRRGQRTVPRSEVRPLLAAWWVPYRHGLDFLSDLAAALLDVTRESLERRDEHGHSFARRVVGSPATWAALGLTVLALVANRDLLGGSPLHGGALLRPPDGVGHWWSAWLHGWHWLGTGTTAPAPPYVLWMALAGTLLLGSATGLVAVLFVLLVPLAMLSAYRFTRRVMPGSWAPAWAAVAYALVPVLSGAVAQGRLGTVAATIVLPFVATSALGLANSDPDRRERAVWRTALGAGVLVAFVPPALFLVVLLTPFAAYLTGRAQDWRRLVAIPATPLLLALPWLVGTLTEPGAWLLEAGRATAVPVGPTALELALGRSGGPGQAPWWISAGLVLAALVALVRSDTRRQVARAWVVVAVAAVLLLAVSWARVALPGLAAPVRPWAGFLVLVVQAGLIVAAGSAAAGVVRIATGSSFGLRQVVGGLAFVAAVAAPLLGLGWWATTPSTGPLTNGRPASLPAYMTDVSATADDSAVLVLRGGGARSDVRYRVLRDGTLRLGDDGVLDLTPEDTGLTRALGGLLAGSQSPVSQQLATRGVAYVYAPPPVSGAVSGALDAADGFTGASAPAEGSRAWKVDGRVVAPTVRSTPLHWLALAVQVVALLAAIVLSLPSRRRR